MNVKIDWKWIFTAGFVLAILLILLGIRVFHFGLFDIELPTANPTQSQATPVIPGGYKLFDAFTSPNSLSERWRLDDSNSLCQLTINDEQLTYDCRNETADDLVATLHPEGQFDSISGIAVDVNVDHSGGAFEVATNWACTAEGTQRAYHFAVNTETARATEYFPQDNWRMNELGRVAIASGQAHLLQIELSGDAVEFLVDGQAIPLQTLPSLSPCFEIREWSLDFYVWKDGNQIGGHVTSVSTRQP